MKADIETVVKFKNWEKIVTHNPNGEYGHEQHKQVNQVVTEICVDNNLQDKLYYFGPYYNKRRIINN